MSTTAFTAPHYKVSEIGQSFLDLGASAIDAMIAASAAISVVYPHMNSLGGDGFWLIHKPGCDPVAIDACGISASHGDMSFYDGLESIPSRGPKAALTMAGTLDGWRVAREWATSQTLGTLSLSELVAPAVKLARDGIQITESLQRGSEKVAPELTNFESYQRCFCPQGNTLIAGQSLQNPGLADFIEKIGKRGTEDFYRGELAHEISSWLESSGSPLRLEDFHHYYAQLLKPLSVNIKGAELFNFSAPTQGVASLLILSIFDKLVQEQAPVNETEFVHLLIESCKQAFIIRDAEVTDSSRLSERWPSLLSDDFIAQLADNISRTQALPWPHVANPGDTVWMGALDKDGCMVSFIQSIYWEFGSGMVHPDYGLTWNNRGTSFSLDPENINSLKPGMKPFHTLNPAFALFEDGRRLSYGTMGGEGQPQTQSVLFSRYHYQGLSLSEAIAKGRWLLGRTWGETNFDLKMENDLTVQLESSLSSLGHKIVNVDSCNEMMGHAGAICLYPDGSADAATDPRSDGLALVGQF